MPGPSSMSRMLAMISSYPRWPTQDGPAIRWACLGGGVVLEVALCRPIGLAFLRSDRPGWRRRRMPAVWVVVGRRSERAGRTAQRWPACWPGGVSILLASLPVPPTGTGSRRLAGHRPKVPIPSGWVPRPACLASTVWSGAVGPAVRRPFDPCPAAGRQRDPGAEPVGSALDPAEEAALVGGRAGRV